MASPKLIEAFVSYSHNAEDAEFCALLCDEFERHGVNAWRDRRQLRVGEMFDQAIVDAIEDSDAFVIVLSPDSVASAYVMRELRHALASFRQDGSPQVFPLLLKPCEVPSELAALTWVDFTTDFQMPFRQLFASLTGEHTDTESYKPVSGSRSPYLDTKDKEATRHYNAGVAAFQRGDLKVAIEHFDLAFELDPNQFDAAYNAAVVEYELAMKGDPTTLLSSVANRYEQVLSIRPSDPDALLNLAVILATDAELLDLPRANELLSKAVQVSPSYALAWLRLGDVRLRQSGLLDMISKPESVSALADEQIDVLVAARDCFRKALTLDPTLQRSFPAMASAPFKIDQILAKCGITKG